MKFATAHRQKAANDDAGAMTFDEGVCESRYVCFFLLHMVFVIYAISTKRLYVLYIYKDICLVSVSIWLGA